MAMASDVKFDPIKEGNEPRCRSRSLSQKSSSSESYSSTDDIIIIDHSELPDVATKNPMTERGAKIPNSFNENLSESQYAKVVFHDLADTYPTDCDIRCSFTVLSGTHIAPDDRIALYKVGWKNLYEYEAFKWVPPFQQGGKSENMFVHFSSSDLPKEPGEFYQFCYVGQSNEVLGASIPFQFHSASDEDLCEIDEDDLLVVRSKTAVLQEQIQKEKECSEALEQKCLRLEETLEGLSAEMNAQAQENSNLQERYDVSNILTCESESEVSDDESVLKRLAAKVSQEQELKTSIEELRSITQQLTLKNHELEETVEKLHIDMRKTQEQLEQKDQAIESFRCMESKKAELEGFLHQVWKMVTMKSNLPLEDTQTTLEKLYEELKAGREAVSRCERQNSAMNDLHLAVHCLNMDKEKLQTGSERLKQWKEEREQQLLSEKEKLEKELQEMSLAELQWQLAFQKGMKKMETYIDGETWGKEVMKESSAVEKFLSAVDTLGMKACSDSVDVWQRRCSQLQADKDACRRNYRKEIDLLKKQLQAGKEVFQEKVRENFRFRSYLHKTLQRLEAEIQPSKNILICIMKLKNLLNEDKNEDQSEEEERPQPEGEGDRVCRCCDLCLPRDTPNTLWLDHMEQSHNKLLCPLCGALFEKDVTAVYQTHVGEHFEEAWDADADSSPIHCPSCPQKFLPEEQDAYRSHVQSHHLTA
ncbi:unnamed protein product [Darwinula stevensoni]|uniref:SKICH domain-containing protein n=1 Tax=Darwinula stevensoni TaxID=69355 RepID=A0A7R9A6M5_9CRUS|nr:unnamed protein product [Darwinula stevensoni]CAG0889731.1 unnamed protein product [Darwinula stevensoni]